MSKYGSHSALLLVSVIAMLAACAAPGPSSTAISVVAASTDTGAQPDLSLLTPLQRRFLESDEPLKVVPSRLRLTQELARRTPEQVQVYVSDMMTALAALSFEPDRDMSFIPLDREATGFNQSQVLKPLELFERKREPGPIYLARYINEWGGFPTFARAPVAVTPEDLIAGQVDVAFAGIPQSLSSGNRDARNAPNAIRGVYGMVGREVHTLVDPFEVLNIVDYGNFNVDRMAMARSIDHVTDMVAQMAATGAVPFLVGGDFSVSYSSIRGVARVADGRPLTVVHLGAHHNAEPPRHHPNSDRDSMFNLLTEGVIEGRNLIQVGLRGPQSTPESLQWLRDQGVRYHTMAQVERNGWEAVMHRVIAEAKATGNAVYLTLDVSVFDPAEVIAAGRSVPNGLTVRELTPLVRRLCAETDIAGMELMDFAPMLDTSLASASNSASMFNACLAGMAIRRLGITEANYLAPAALDHGQRRR
jgi:arginase family enzyme